MTLEQFMRLDADVHVQIALFVREKEHICRGRPIQLIEHCFVIQVVVAVFRGLR